ncbi:MAG: hypothetical protein RIT81_47530 [Deltaproteobacteria bacterium]
MALRDLDSTLMLDAHLRNLGDTSQNLTREPGLTDAERQHFAASKLHTQAIALRAEHPVMGRFAEYLNGKAGSLTEPEWNTLTTLIGPKLSRIERDFLDQLRQSGRFNDDFRVSTVEPYRAQMIGPRNAAAKGAGLVRAGQTVAVAGAQLGVLAGGFFLTPYLFAATVLYQLFAAKPVSNAIAKNFDRKVGAHGINSESGAEVDDESRLALSTLSPEKLVEAKSVDDVVGLAKQHVDVMTTLAKLRGDAAPNADLAAVFAGVDNYAAGVQTLLEQHAAKPQSASELKATLFELQAAALSPDTVWSAVRSSVAENFGPVDGQQDANFAFVQSELFQFAEQMLAPDAIESPGDEAFARNHADMYLRAALHQERLGENAGAIDPHMRAFMAAIVESPADAAASPAGQTFAKKIEKVRSNVEEARTTGDKARIDKKDARAIGKKLAQQTLGTIIPRFVDGGAEPPSPSAVRARATKEGFSVSMDLVGGIFSGVGRMTVNVRDDGAVDVDSLKIDVGRSQAVDVVKALLAGLAPEAKTGKSRATDTGYSVTARRRGHDPLEIGVSKQGIPDLRTASGLLS